VEKRRAFGQFGRAVELFEFETPRRQDAKENRNLFIDPAVRRRARSLGALAFQFMIR
jgi:hypothetical protein